MVFAKARERMINMSFRVKLPLMISLLVTLVLAVTAVLSYTVAAVITLDKSKDEIKATSDRIGAGLFTSLTLEEQSTFLITKHRTFQDLLEIRNSEGQNDDVFSRKIVNSRIKPMGYWQTASQGWKATAF